jgi:Transglutaminase-like superfamily
MQAQQCLKHMHPTLAHAPHLSRSLRILQAQKDTMLLKGWMHLIIGNRACFAESFALCAGLHYLGFPCRIVVGYAQIEQFTLTPLHAWVEYEGIPLGNPLDVQYCYAEIHHYSLES